MNSDEVSKLVEQYRVQYDELSHKLSHLVTENEHLRALQSQVQNQNKTG